MSASRKKDTARVPLWRSLAFRLSLGFLLVLGVVSVVLGQLALRTGEEYVHEVQQEVHRGTAEWIASMNALYDDAGQLDPGHLKEVFMHLMKVNPTLEVYVLDPEGEILAYDAPEGVVVRERVALEPVRHHLEGEEGVVFGDDPRDASGRKVFSVAPIEHGGEHKGFVYAIVASEVFQDQAVLLQRSYILRGAAIAGLVVLLVAAAGGIGFFALLTTPLRRLTRAIERFQRGDREARVESSARDEIGYLSASYDRMADRIVGQMDQLRFADELRRELVANISHDLRTPLASVQGHVETCLLRGDQLAPDEHRRHLETALRNTHRLGRLVDDLFQLSRLDAGEVRPHVERFSLSELVMDAVQKFRLAAEKRGVELVVRIPDGMPLVSADIGLIERVLDNLLDNALRYTPEGGKVAVSLAEHAGSIEVRVADTGRGIPAEDLPRIFDRFYRVEKSRTDDAGGTGLGLAIAKRILDLHDAALEVRSRLGLGTVFRFELAS